MTLSLMTQNMIPMHRCPAGRQKQMLLMMIMRCSFSGRPAKMNGDQRDEPDRRMPRKSIVCIWLCLACVNICYCYWRVSVSGATPLLPRIMAVNPHRIRPVTHTHTQTTILRFSGFCPGQPGTRRNIYLLTPIVVINHPLSASSILLWSMASSLFKLRACQSFSTISLQVFFGLPFGLAPSTSYSIHFFTQSLSSFRSTFPYHHNLFCCSTMIMLCY